MKSHRQIRSCKSKPRKFGGKCEHCGKPICSCKAYQYADDSNAAISNSAPWLCGECYEKKYGLKLKSDVEIFRSRLIDKVLAYHSHGVKFGDIDTILRLINLV